MSNPGDQGSFGAGQQNQNAIASATVDWPGSTSTDNAGFQASATQGVVDGASTSFFGGPAMPPPPPPPRAQVPKNDV
jgi:hypothetical protein